jgi:hypothetical protein
LGLQLEIYQKWGLFFWGSAFVIVAALAKLFAASFYSWYQMRRSCFNTPCDPSFTSYQR